MIVSFDAEGKPVSQASGFFIAPDIVATNFHALKWAASAVVTPYSTKLQIPVTAVSGIDLANDLCLLQVAPQRFRSLKLAVTPVKIGDPIYVIGNPLGLEGTFSSGIVSAVRGDNIQIDAPISHGSSGGPVLNRAGEVIGIATSYLSGGQNLNFAVSSTLIANMPRKLELAVKTAGAAAISDLEYRHLKGQVRSYTETVSDIDYPEDVPTVGPERVLNSERFNEDGAIADENVARLRSEAAIPQPPRGFVLEDGSERAFSVEISAIIDAIATSHSYSTTIATIDGAIVLDGRGNEVEHTKGKERWVTKYDNDDRPIETQAYYDAYPDYAVQYTYRLDDQGNWITKEECYVLENFKDHGCRPTAVYRRSISYFPEL